MDEKDEARLKAWANDGTITVNFNPHLAVVCWFIQAVFVAGLVIGWYLK